MTHLSKEKFANMRKAKEEIRQSHPPPDYPDKLPLYRRRITVEDFDFGYKKVVFDLYDSGRVDSYTVVEDGIVIAWRKGFARILNSLLLDRFKRVQVI